MARPISDEELQLKRRARRRLIGAIVFVAAIVVALPMVLDTEPRPIDGEIDIKIPPPDSSKFTSRMVPVPPSAEPRSAGGEKSAAGAKSAPDKKATPKFSAAMGEKAVEPDAKPPAAATPAPKSSAAAAPASKPPSEALPGKSSSAASPAPMSPSTASPALKPEPPVAAEPPARSAAGPASAPAAGEPGAQMYAVQVVALADADKAKRVQEQMAAAGLKSYTEVVQTAKGEVTRVRAGPYASRAAAEKAHDQLKTLGLSGNIVAK
jgi:DedD protein